jgi:3-methyladenine DNA glycosylase Tag
MNIIDHKQKVEAIIKNMKTISAEVKKMQGKME